jgi:hypothetical protein
MCKAAKINVGQTILSALLAGENVGQTILSACLIRVQKMADWNVCPTKAPRARVELISS